MRILIIDDDADLAEILSTAFTTQEYDVDMAFSGKEGLDKLLEEDYDCVVLDVVMPEMDGLEVMRKIRASRLDVWVPVILITGKNVIEDERRVFSLGAVDYIKKPFEFDELLKRVNLSAERGKILRRFQGKKKFSGKIDLLLIQHIIGFISIGQLSGMLQVTNVDMEGVLFFINGNLVNIRLEEQIGMKNFDEIMDWKDGIYSFVEWETGLEMTIETLKDMLFFTELEEGSYILRCESMGKKGKIHIQGGNIIYVEGNGLRGEDALKDILTWREGTLNIEKTDRLKKGVKLKKSISEILLETLRFKIKKSKPEELKKEEEEKKIEEKVKAEKKEEKKEKAKEKVEEEEERRGKREEGREKKVEEKIKEEKKIEGKKEDIKEKVKIDVREREEKEEIKEEVKGKEKEEIKMEEKKRIEEEEERRRKREEGREKKVEEKIKIDVEKLNSVIEDMKKDLGDALITTVIYSSADGKSAASYNEKSKTSALFNQATRYLINALKDSEFSSIGKYYIVDLVDEKMLIVIPLGEYQWGMLIDREKAQLGLLLNVVVPKIVDAFKKAVV